MKKHLRKAMLVVVSISLMISMFGCGNGGSSSASTQSGDKGSAGTSQTSTADAKKPITLTAFTTKDPNQADGIQNDPVAQYIKEQTGITIDLRTGDLKTVIPAMLASGDLTDLVYIDDSNLISNFVKADAIIDMEPLIEANAPHFKGDVRVPFSKKYLSNGTGKFYFMPVQAGPSGGYSSADVNFTIRWDLYKKLGYPEVNTLMDLIPVLKKMQDMEPVNQSGKKNYALGLWTDWGLCPLTMVTQVMGGYSQDSFPGLVQINQDNREVKSLISTPDSILWKEVDFYNAAYKAGILDPDSFIQKWDQYTQKMNNLRYLATFPDWATSDAAATIKSLGQSNDKGFGQLPPLKDEKIVVGDSGENKFGNQRLWCISKNCKNPERAMQLLDFFNDEDQLMTVYNGIKGKYWTEENGTATYTKEYADAIDNNVPKFKATTGVQLYAYNFALKNTGFINKKYNKPLDLLGTDPARFVQDYDPKQKPIKYDSVAHYGLKYQSQMIQKYNLKTVADDRTILKLLAPPPDDIKLIDSKIFDYVTNEIYKAIMTTDPTQFAAMKQKIVDDCNSMGLQKSLDFWLKNYKDSYTNLDSIK